ncbi:MAG TPA: tetratricopeptide repeat protein [Terriglobales bacterium]|jgi:tetratricopeptide (TPR) repeat protein
MAFGFGFNKQKALSAAEKFVQQGKLQNAIAEYEKVIKADPKDLTVTNTIGDLYARIGENEKAVDCFKGVGDAYATQGFTVKAIAMYKKLSKIKSSLESTLRLAELYTQQGLFNDARAQYLQVAEEFLKAGELEQAVRIFQKTLEMDPDNTPMRMKLADVYIRLGKKNEAWQIFAAAAESLRAKGSLDQAEEILNKMLKMDPTNSYALLLRGRTAFDAGDLDTAIENLEKVPDLDSNVEGLRTLLQAYLQTGRLPDAGNLAPKLLTVHGDTGAILIYAETLVSAAQFEAALQVYDEYSDRLLAADPAKVLDSLHSIIGHVRDNTAALESLIHLFNKAGENTHVTEVYELLAHAYVQAGELDRAREYYQKLAQLEPQNALHMQNLQQVVTKGGGSSSTRLITAEEGAMLVEELEAAAPFIEQRYSNDIALSVRAALTDAELFVSYNMPEKAMTPLLSALPQAPRDMRLNQRLAALHTRASRFAEGAVCCRILESLYHDAGHPDEASRYGELAVKYEERATVPAQSEGEAPSVPAWPTAQPAAPIVATPAPTPVQAPVFAAPAATPAPPVGLSFAAPAASAAPAVNDFQIEGTPAAAENEIDISAEWEDSHEIADPAPSFAPAAEAPAPTFAVAAQAPVAAAPLAVDTEAIAQVVEEVRFYLANGMVEEARGSLSKLEALRADKTILATLRIEIAAAQIAHPRQEPPAIEEVSVAFSTPEPEVVSVPTPAPASAPTPIQVQEISVMPAPQAAPEPQFEVAAANNATANHAAANFGGLGDFVSQLESSLGKDLPAASAEPVAAASVAQPAPVPEPQVIPEPVIHVPVAESPAAAPQAAPEPVAEVPTPAPRPAAVAAPKEKIKETPAAANALGDFVSDLERSLGEDFFPPAAPEAPAPKAPATPAAQPWPTTPAAAAKAEPQSEQQPQHVVAQPAAIPAAVAQPAPVAMAAAASSHDSVISRSSAPIQPHVAPVASDAGVDLADMFGELKQELEQDSANADEDPETHYNLGVAFREMGLLDEAIGELQKVCAAVDRGHVFPQLMQTYTWLAQCFLDKGVPEAAIRWYEQALMIPNLDQETKTALHYELASAHDAAQNKPAALQHFMEVYGKNIDYRDVAERIKALKS